MFVFIETPGLYADFQYIRLTITDSGHNIILIGWLVSSRKPMSMDPHVPETKTIQCQTFFFFADGRFIQSARVSSGPILYPGTHTESFTRATPFKTNHDGHYVTVVASAFGCSR